ncbi:MAG: rod shape-determining protein MreC [Alphaproteobacteria bacterium]|nr:rod shape-determining protein MreC [Alphaproteobacteria bacterium]
MARKTRKHSTLMLPTRSSVVRVGQFFLLTLLLLLLVLGRSGNPYVMTLKAQLGDALVPVLSVAAAPFDALRGVSAGAKNWVMVYQQNQSLKNENRELLKWQALAKELQVENEKLRRLLHVAPKREAHFATATIVSAHGSAFSSAALINAGKEDGVVANQPVISERGLVGRVTGSGDRSAQVLLLTDMSSRIPVMNERTREKMILVGRGERRPGLSYVATDSATRKGDRIITSGDGGIFPKNIAVGIVGNADKAAMRVDLFANSADIEYVSVVQYDK